MSDQMVKTVVTKRLEQGIDSTPAVTPSQESGFLVVAMRPIAIILIRSARNYVQSFSGLLTAAGLGADAVFEAPIFPREFASKVTVCAALAVAPAFFCLVQNTGELLWKLDQKFPEMRA